MYVFNLFRASEWLALDYHNSKIYDIFLWLFFANVVLICVWSVDDTLASGVCYSPYSNLKS